MAKPLILGVLGSTRGTDLQGIIDAIERKELNAKIAIVISDRADSFILERAKKHSLETYTVDYKSAASREDAEKMITKKLREKRVGLVLLIGFMKIITPYLISQFSGRMWNIHPSLLPKYSGGINLDVYEQVLKNREKETGCTLHEVSEKVDSGRIILQKKTAVLPTDTPASLKEKVQKLEQQALLEAIKMVIEGRLVIGGQSGKQD